jgi:hypothetical protein
MLDVGVVGCLIAKTRREQNRSPSEAVGCFLQVLALPVSTQLCDRSGLIFWKSPTSPIDLIDLQFWISKVRRPS